MLPKSKAVRYISLETFHLLSTDPETYLVDVRTAEAFDESHIPGAKNICVYEIAFMDAIEAAYPDRESQLIVYGESAEYKAAEAAFAKLEQAGYGNAQVLEGGLAAWNDAKRLKEKNRAGILPSSSIGTLNLDLERSTLRWIGRNPTNQHDGKIALKSGWIELDEEGAILAGEVVVNMKAISCCDISDDKLNRTLIAHLANSDFFEVERYPEASFIISQTEPIPGSNPGQPNVDVYGEMTLRGKTHPIDFQAMLTPFNEAVSFQAQFDVNRVLFGAVYGSGSIFERLGMHLVNDFVNVQITAIFA